MSAQMLDKLGFFETGPLSANNRSVNCLGSFRIRHGENGGFFNTAADGEKLIERTESQHDSPLPSGRLS